MKLKTAKELFNTKGNWKAPSLYWPVFLEASVLTHKTVEELARWATVYILVEAAMCGLAPVRVRKKGKVKVIGSYKLCFASREDAAEYARYGPRNALVVSYQVLVGPHTEALLKEDRAIWLPSTALRDCRIAKQKRKSNGSIQQPYDTRTGKFLSVA